MAARRRPAVLAQLLSRQQSLFTPAPPEPPSFDQLCPPPAIDQLELEVDAAIRAGCQTTIDDFTSTDA